MLKTYIGGKRNWLMMKKLVRPRFIKNTNIDKALNTDNAKDRRNNAINIYTGTNRMDHMMTINESKFIELVRSSPNVNSEGNVNRT